ncbi:protein of unknown function [Amycolatopsis arida]|uniref:Protein-glutamine gamma-glutamyltransferase-like C-terminal domain-containing protein n=1 Tax=Amycolatopsis arida TaxID=587909 RepID=A0A1I5WC38_9PSEU|nr:DUF4129 domain-containing protein [Amycolatopsis arida]TDX92207.1 uncharacterized protein DUF4129 [Amycolatopsis arida]SFQ17197.1 protein of unknown function [Amycolatopsis arida]
MRPGWPADVPVDIGRDEAREAARAELADPAYEAARPSLLGRALRWVFERVSDLLDGAAGLVPGGPFGLVVLLAVLVVLVVVIRLRTGRIGRARRADRVVFADPRRSAAEYRAEAERALAEGRLDDALRARFRGLVRGLEERGVLDERSGRTADEAALDAGLRLPDHAAELRAAAVRFDEVHYGGRPATREVCQRLAELDEAILAARPVVPA